MNLNNIVDEFFGIIGANSLYDQLKKNCFFHSTIKKKRQKKHELKAIVCGMNFKLQFGKVLYRLQFMSLQTPLIILHKT